MLSIKVLKPASADYYLDLAAEDYYFNGGEPPGKWYGHGCNHLGLAGRVQREHFRRLFSGYHPTEGTGPKDPPKAGALVQNAGRENRRAGFDLTFSLPKSLSVIWSQASQELRDRIERLCEEAVRETFDFIQDQFGYARTGKAGQGKMIQSDLVCATFLHGTSRAAEPQLHWHTTLINLARGVDGKWRTLDPKPIFKNKMLLGAIFRSKVAHKFHREFGLRANRKGNCFDFAGVPQKAMDAHSTRAKEIRADMKAKGRVGAVAAARSTLETRGNKKHLPRTELLEQWRAVNALHGFDDRALERLLYPVETDYARLVPEILITALKNIENKRNHFTAHDFMREALYVAPEYGVAFEHLQQPLEEFLHLSPEIVPIPNKQRYTTRNLLELEHKMLRNLGKIHGRRGVQVSDEQFIKLIADHKHLTDEQREAVRHLLLNDSAIRVVQGYAGTGKTTMLRTAVQGWQKAGFNVVGACFTGAAAEVLEQEIGVPCDTINMTLADFNDSLADILKRWGKHSFKQLFRAARGRKTYAYRRPKPVDINARTVVLIDEAGMVNTRHMQMLMEWAEKNNATLVLTGDEAQLHAVEGGSPLHSISKRVGCAMMTDIKRQTDYWACAASYYLARGEVLKAMELYDQRHLLRVDEDVDASLKRLVDEWEHHSYDCTDRNRILTLTNDLAHEANQMAQERLLARGLLNPKKKRVITDRTDSGNVYSSNVHVGDRILFTQNSRVWDVRNGMTGTVLGFTYTTKQRPQEVLKVRLDSGRVVKVPLTFQHMRLGYASTVHKAQGGTFDQTFTLIAGGYHNLPTSYVMGTRSRLATHLYTVKDFYDQLSELEESRLVSEMEREVDLSLATDLFEPNSVTTPTAEALVQKVVDDWQQEAAPQDSLILTADEETARRLNDECNARLYAMAQTDWNERHRGERGDVDPEPLPTCTNQDRTFFVGTRVRFQEGARNMAEVHREHDLGTVTEIQPELNRMTVRLDRQVSAEFLVDAMPSMDHGYATDVQQAQQAGYRLKKGYLVQPDSFTSIGSPSTLCSYVDSTSSLPTQSTFGNSQPFTFANSDLSFTSVNNYMSQEAVSQMAADWQQKSMQINQSTQYQVTSTYTHTETSLSHKL